MKKITLILGVVLGVVLGFAIPTWAARNSGGTFTWTAPGGEVAAAGQTISSAWANSSLAEVRQALTDSLDRKGNGGMLAALKICDASTGATPACNLASSPGLRFESSTNTGLYLDSGPALSVAVGGSNPLDITATSVTANVALRSSTSLVLEDPGAGSFTATVAAPTLGASYSMTLPTALPGSTLPVTLTSGGQLGTGQITNAMQNFGTPSASTDVFTLGSYNDRVMTYVMPSAWTSASSTPSDLTGMSASLAANTSYRVSAHLAVYDAGSCVGSANFQFTGPAGAALRVRMMGGNTATGYVGSSALGLSTFTGNVPCNTNEVPVLLEGTITTSSTAGTLQLQGRKTATGSGTIGVTSSSDLVVTRL